MGQLNNLYVSSSYQGLLKLTDSTQGLTNTLQTVQTGDGDNSPLQMSLTEINISGSFYLNGLEITGSTSGTSGTSGSSGSSGSNGSSGTSGSSGTGFNYLGVWDNTVTYNTNDVVTYGGQSYVALSSNTNKQPSIWPAIWSVFSASGSSGTSGTSGSSGSNGSSGTSGSSGSSGTSGSSGSNGSSGTSGSSGSNGSSGTSGSSGSNGSSGTSGSNGSSGTSGSSGSNGSSGTSGSSGSTGTSGSSGSNGSSGTSGNNGSSGTSGSNGSSGTSGSNGSSGTSGSSGSDGSSGTTGSSGTSGNDGLGLPSKVISTVASNFTYVNYSSIYPGLSGSTQVVTFAQPFSSSDYSVDLVWQSNITGFFDSYFSNSNTYADVTISGKTASGFTAIIWNWNLQEATYSGITGYYNCIAAGSSNGSGTSGSSGTSGASPFAQTGSFYATTNNLQITGSLRQSGTFYPDQIDWIDSSIVQGTGSYVLTTDTSGVTHYDTYANIAGALSPYISSNRDGLITTGSISEIQSITGSLNLTTIDNTTITTSEGNVSLDGGSNIFYTSSPGPVLGYFFANNITGVTVNGPGVSNAIVTEYGNSGDPNYYGTATLSSGTVTSGELYTFTGPYPIALSINADKLKITGSVYSSQGYNTPGGLSIQNPDNSGVQYGGVGINCAGADQTNIFSSFNVSNGSPEGTLNMALSSYNPAYNGEAVPTIYAGGYYDGGQGWGATDTTMTFYSSSIQMWKPTSFKAPVAITGSVRINGNTIVTGSLRVNGNTSITGSLNVSAGITGSLQGTSSFATNARSSSFATNATSSSFATTSSFATNAISSSFATNATSSSFATTSSFASNFSKTGLITTGSIGITQNITGSLNIYNGYGVDNNSIIVTGSILTSGSINGMNFWRGPNDSGTQVGIGTNALKSSISGSYNLAIGGGALQNNISGSDNVALGTGTLNNNLASGNLAIGSFTLSVNTLGTNNNAIGRGCLSSNTIGNYNLAIGDSALYANVSSSYNTAIGNGALGNNTAEGNTAIGSNALAQNTIGASNIAIGQDSMTQNSSGVGNIGIGKSALGFLTTGNSNVAIGRSSAIYVTSGNVNTAIGSFALFSGGTSQGNTAIGSSTMQYASGSDNIVIGVNAGIYMTGSKHILFDNQDRTSNGYQNGSIIYGTMDATPSNQTLNINAATNITNNLVVSGSLSVGGNLQFNVGAFQSTQTQSGSANVSQSITYDTTDYSQGVTYVSGSRLTVANKGVYNIQFSAQIDRVAGSGTDTVYIWLKKNGTNLAGSAGSITISGGAAAAKTISSWNYVVDSAANDYYELVWQSTDSNIQLIAATATGNIPSIPSIITTVTQVR